MFALPSAARTIWPTRLVSVAPPSIQTLATSIAVLIIILAAAPEIAPPVLKVSVPPPLKLLTAESDSAPASPEPMSTCRTAPDFTSTSVVKAMVVVSVAPAMLASPPVVPLMLFAAKGLLKILAALPTMESASTRPARMSVTVELTVFETMAPAPARNPKASAVTDAATVALCVAEMVKAPEPLWPGAGCCDSVIEAPCPTVAVVVALSLVLGSTAAPDTMPPEPAVVSAESVSFPPAPICAEPAVMTAPCPTVAAVLFDALALLLDRPPASNPRA